jgi:hypothetical protein
MKSKFTKVVWYYCLQCFLWTVVANPQASAQQIVQVGVLFYPLHTAGNSIRTAAQLQSLYYVPKLAILGGVSYDKHDENKNDYIATSQNFTQFLEGRYFPYRKPDKALKVLTISGCYSFSRQSLTFWEKFVGSFYGTIGFGQRQTDLKLYLKEAPQKLYEVKIQTRALTLGVGTQLQLSKLVIGLGYGVGLSRPAVQGDELGVFQNQLLTHSFPIPIRIEQGLNIEIGLQF